MKSVSFSFKPLSHIDVLLDAVDDHFQRDEVLAALGNNEVRVFLAGLHELLVHGLDGGEILADHRVQAPPPLLHIPGDAAEDTHIGVGIHKNLDVHQVPKGLVLKDQDAFHQNDLGGADLHGLAGSVMDGVVVHRTPDRLPPLEGLDIPEQKFDKMYVTKDLYRIYCQLLEECGLDPLSGAEYERRKIPYEDVFPMLYLKYRLEGGNHSHKNIKHLVIDEMQDYSYLQYTILANLFSCKMTILGDRAQTMDVRQQDVLKFLPRILGRDLHKIEMNKSYRNTVEIAEYAAKISGIEDLILLDRHGKEVAEQTFASEDFLLDAVQENLNEEFETAALLTMTEEEALELNRLLKLRGAEVAYIDKNSSSFKKGLTVTTFYLAKGLEFDQVFAVRGKEQNPLRQQAEYICATRALHELYMYEIADV